MNVRFRHRLGVILLLAAAGVTAQEHDQAALLQSSPWSGSLTWMSDQATESIAVEFDDSSGQMTMRASGTRDVLYRVSESGLLLKLERIEATSQPNSEGIAYRVVPPDVHRRRVLVVDKQS